MDVLAEGSYQNQGARKRGTVTRACQRRDYAISFIRTVTVGSGIAPDLLTPKPAQA